MAVPILTYHCMRIGGADRAGNDLVALADDLDFLLEGGWTVLPLVEIVDRWLADPHAFEGGRVVGLTCDDGGDFDFRDLPHPAWGVQRSAFNALRDAHARHGIRPHLTTFVIVSPEARRELDRTCMIGRGWWSDDWWAEAAASGYMHVASHSWDHNHETLPESFAHGVARGTFATIDTEPLAAIEIDRAQDYLGTRAPNAGRALFAYPYGESNPWLRDDYLPRHAARLGLRAAFGTRPEPITPSSPRWDLPRYVHGRDWDSREGLEAILARRFPFVLEGPEAPDAATNELFRRAFGVPAPDFPHHFVARAAHERTKVAGYVHYTEYLPGVYLCGGLCVDARVYRGLGDAARRAIADRGSLSRWLLASSIESLERKRAVFAFTGDTRSRRDVLELGFTVAREPHLFVQWHGEPPASRVDLVAKVAALGPF